ncbi:MAG: hypothetical protein IPL53_19090 [Ignavibacteria bacterium]|nr:hypothetical protein [Ignavibacteria bacterium]
MEIKYKTLFSVELQHDYYNQQEAFNDIEIIPTENTKKYSAEIEFYTRYSAINSLRWRKLMGPANLLLQLMIIHPLDFF